MRARERLEASPTVAYHLPDPRNRYPPCCIAVFASFHSITGTTEDCRFLGDHFIHRAPGPMLILAPRRIARVLIIIIIFIPQGFLHAIPCAHVER